MKKLCISLLLVAGISLQAMEPAAKKQKTDNNTTITTTTSAKDNQLLSKVVSLKKQCVNKLVGVRGDKSKAGILDGHIEHCFDNKQFVEKEFDKFISELKEVKSNILELGNDICLNEEKIANQIISYVQAIPDIPQSAVVDFKDQFILELANLFGRSVAIKIQKKLSKEAKENYAQERIEGVAEALRLLLYIGEDGIIQNDEVEFDEFNFFQELAERYNKEVYPDQKIFNSLRILAKELQLHPFKLASTFGTYDICVGDSGHFQIYGILRAEEDANFSLFKELIKNPSLLGTQGPSFTPDMQDAFGNSLLHYVSFKDITDISLYQYLIDECKINPTLKNINNETALENILRRSNPNTQVVSYLKQAEEEWIKNKNNNNN